MSPLPGLMHGDYVAVILQTGIEFRHHYKGPTFHQNRRPFSTSGLACRA